MSEPKLISPLLDSFAMGEPISEHDGVRCCPAIDERSNKRYIVKIISIPQSPAKLEALLLTGAYSTPEQAGKYFGDLADGVVQEAQVLTKLSHLEGFLPYENWQIRPMDDQVGYDVYLLGEYRRSLERQFRREPLTQLQAVNLGLDMCAALSVCRQAGYLYVDLKPDNVYITEKNEFKIGDLGFVRLSSLKYASLPDTYRSAYTPPEITDAMSSLNETMDIYALGLILYQAYNNGQLPFQGQTAPGEAFPPPEFADYEMAEIILKACAPDPKDRWQNPSQMGQALVTYMQRNGANDTPIIALVDSQPAAPEEAPAQALEEETSVQEDGETETAETGEATESQPEEKAESQPEEGTEYYQDELGNLSFLEDALPQEDMPTAEDAEDISYEEVSTEVSEMMSQVDDIAAHPVPDPVVAPEAIDVPIPAPLPIETEEEAPDQVDSQEESQEEAQEEPQDGEEEAEDPEEEAEEVPPLDEETLQKKKHRKKVILVWTITLLLVAALAAGGFCFYKYYYVQTVDGITVSGDHTALTVTVDTQADPANLYVTCTDDYGNRYTAEIQDGKALFSNLTPNTYYTVQVQAKGFRTVHGNASQTYTTPTLINVVKFDAVTGTEEGSAILTFTTEGGNSAQTGSWNVTYYAEGEEEKTVSCTGNTVTITGLTLGKEYTFQILPQNNETITGTTILTFVPQKLIYPKNLQIISCVDGKMTATWEAPADTQVASWTAHCYLADGTYVATQTVSQPTVTFEDIDPAQGYIVEVVAEGMSVSERVTLEPNSITLSNLAADTSVPGTVTLTWDANQQPEQWKISYQIEGFDQAKELTTKENTISITGLVPDVAYTFQVTTEAGNVLGGTLKVNTPAAEVFSCSYDNFTVTAQDMSIRMCKTPSTENWNQNNVKKSDYTTEFAVGEKASFVLNLKEVYGLSDDPVAVTYVVTDAEGKILSVDTQNTTWNDMWEMYYACLDVPQLPSAAGAYKLSIYFNGGFVTTQDFTMVA